MEAIQYKLEQFEGPLDLLLTLIIKNKINIDDIPIALLCEQYMDCIRANLAMDVAVAAEFLYMASELMLIKSRMLLPRDPEKEEDPRAALRDTVLEYQKTKLAAAELSDLFAQYGGRMCREQDDISPDPTFVSAHTLECLRAALTRAMTESKTLRQDNNMVFEPIVHQKHVPVQAMTHSLLRRLQNHETVYLDTFFSASASHSEMVAKFLSLLELFKTRIITLPETAWEDPSVETGGVVTVCCHIPILLESLPDPEQLAALTEYS